MPIRRHVPCLSFPGCSHHTCPGLGRASLHYFTSWGCSNWDQPSVGSPTAASARQDGRAVGRTGLPACPLARLSHPGGHGEQGARGQGTPLPGSQRCLKLSPRCPRGPFVPVPICQQQATCAPACLRLSQGDIAICCPLLDRTCQPALATRAGPPWPSLQGTVPAGTRVPQVHRVHRGSTRGPLFTQRHLLRMPRWHQTPRAAQRSRLQPAARRASPTKPLQVYPTQGLCSWPVRSCKAAGTGCQQCPSPGARPLPTARLCKHQAHRSELQRSKTLAPSAALGSAADSPAAREHTPPALLPWLLHLGTRKG